MNDGYDYGVPSSNSSGMTSEESSWLGQSTLTSQASSSDTCKHSHKSSLTAGGVHWGHTKVHTYDRNDSISLETSHGNKNPSFCSSSVQDIDVDEVIERYEAAQQQQSNTKPLAITRVHPDRISGQAVFQHVSSGRQLPQVPSSQSNKTTLDEAPLFLPRSVSHSCSSICSSNDGTAARNRCYQLVQIQHQCRHQSMQEMRALSPLCPNPQELSQPITISLAEVDSPFGRLPAHLLTHVLENLSSPADLCRSAAVCKRWYTTAWDPTLWTCLRLDICAQYQPRINIDTAIKTITKILSYLTYPVCMCIHRVILTDCQTLTNKGLSTIARICPQLQSLDIRRCQNVTNIALFELISCCTHLEVLLASGCSQISCLSIVPGLTSPSSPLPVQNRGVALRLLDLSNCPRLDTSGLCILANHCPQLGVIFLRRCPLVEDSGVTWLARCCHYLREISLNECRRITDASIIELAQALGQRLRYLSVCKCINVTDNGIIALSNNCHRLRYLNLRGCFRVSDNSLERLAESTSTRLCSLDVSCCDISDDTLLSLAQHCHQLRCLALRGCDAVTDKGLLSLFQRDHVSSITLKMVALQGCSVAQSTCRHLRQHFEKCTFDFVPLPPVIEL